MGGPTRRARHVQQSMALHSTPYRRLSRHRRSHTLSSMLGARLLDGPRSGRSTRSCKHKSTPFRPRPPLDTFRVHANAPRPLDHTDERRSSKPLGLRLTCLLSYLSLSYLSGLRSLPIASLQLRCGTRSRHTRSPQLLRKSKSLPLDRSTIGKGSACVSTQPSTP